MKFGFRELLIVLVVGGLGYLLSTIFREQLVDVAIQKEIANIEEIVLAVNLYYNDISKSTITDTHAITGELVEKNHLAEHSLFSKYNGMYWTFTACTLEDNASMYSVPDNITDNTSICMYLSPFRYVDEYSVNRISSKFVCYVETMADDSSLLGGDGRGTLKMNNGIGAQIWDCDKENATTTGEYLYRVF